MAGNYIVINSKFKPFSYQEMLHPAMMATQAHQAVEQEYADMSTKASVWEERANEQTDPYAYGLYKKYSDDLRAQADVLSKRGLDPLSRNKMFQMRERYGSEITPIEEAYAARLEEAKRQQEMRDKDSSIIFDREATTTSLDKYIKNPNLQHRALSVNELYATASRDFAEAAKKVQRPGEWKKALNGEYWERDTRAGYTPQEINAVISGDPNAPQELKDLYNSTLDSYMSRGQWDAQGAQAIRDAINRGASYGLGSVSSQLQSRKAYDYAQQERLALLKARPPKSPGLTNVDRSMYGFPRSRERIPSIIDETGKLVAVPNKYKFAAGKNDLTKELFKNDKFTDPGKVKTETAGMFRYSDPVKSAAKNYYDEISETLQDQGYSIDFISKMSKKDVELALQNAQAENSADITGKNVYRLKLDPEGTKQITAQLKTTGDKVREIKGMKDGAFEYGKYEDLPELKSGEVGNLLFDVGVKKDAQGNPIMGSNNNYIGETKIVLQTKGKYYEMPIGGLSLDTQNYLNANLPYAQDAKNTLDELDEIQRTRTLTK